MSEFAPLIYVDLVEDAPLSLDDWYEREGGVTTDFEDDAALDAAHRQYLERFQPWRLLIKSGDNQEPLFRSTESYFNKADALHAVSLAFGPYSNVYLRSAEHGNQVLRMAQK